MKLHMWCFLPPIAERGRLPGKLSVFASALVFVACLGALYLPIFLVGKA